MNTKHVVTKSVNKALVITTAIMLFVLICFGIANSIGKSRQVVESYRSEITLKETIVLDDQNTLNKFNGPITLEKGTKGEILDAFDWYSESHGYKHIKARFTLDDKRLDVILVFEKESEGSEDNIQVVDSTITIGNGEEQQIIPGTITVSDPPFIDINSVEDSQRIIFEFQQVRESYNQKVKQTVIIGSVISVIIAIALVSVVWIIKAVCHKDKIVRIILIVSACIDVVLVIATSLELYFIAWL